MAVIGATAFRRARGRPSAGTGRSGNGFWSAAVHRTPDWCFAAQLAHRQSLDTAFADWAAAIGPKDPKGRVILLYLHAEDDSAQVDESVREKLKRLLAKHSLKQAPI